MSIKLQGDSESPSASSVFLPLSRRRRGSVGSINSQVDKETLSQALDNIHNAASQSETLTTFNEYTSPPTSSTTNDNKGITGDIQGGISGLYSRFRTSISQPRELPSAGPNSIDEARPGKSERNITPLSSTITEDGPKNAQMPSSVLANISSMLDSQPPPEKPLKNKAPMDKASLAKDAHVQSIPQHLNQPDKPALNSGNPGNVSKTSSSLRPALVPLGQSGSSIAAAQVAEVNINATRSPAPLKGSDAILPNSPVPSDLSISRSTSILSEVPTAKLQLNQAYLASNQNSVAEPRSGIASETASLGSPKFPDEQLGFGQSNKTTIKETQKQGPSYTSEELLRTQRSAPAPTNRPKVNPVIHQISRPSSEIEVPRNILPAFKVSVPSVSGTSNITPVTSPLKPSFVSQPDSEEESLHTVGRLRSKQVNRQKSESSQRSTGVLLSNVRTRVLSKEYWMRDENAKDCFYCGDPFSTFRRKHHCRTCGQIFDAKCTSLVSGVPFGQSGTLRVCKPCEGIINGYDDSSEYSDEGSVVDTRPRHGSSGAADMSPTRSFTGKRTSNTDLRNDAVPTMAIPATRRLRDESKRKPPAVLEIDSEPRLARPGSSRSLKSSMGLRTHPTLHKRHHSRHLHRGMKTTSDDIAPFHRLPAEDTRTEARLPAFHSDNVIDPDLAAFLSDEESSADEQGSIMATMNSDSMSKSPDPERGMLSALFSGTRKGRSRMGDKSYSGITAVRDPDSASLSSAKMGNTRPAKKRNLSMSNPMYMRSSPRVHRFSTSSFAHIPTGLQESPSGSPGDRANTPESLCVMRSSAMRGADAPAMELNSASIQHVKKMLKQLLTDAQIRNAPAWEKALIPILLQATDDVNPDVQNGDDIDIRHYVKLKKIPGGKPGDTAYVSGLVFTKNLALKSMPRSISRPNILILTFPLEYSRHKQNLMTLELLIRQEKEYLQNLVHRIAALRPQLLFCQKNVSRLALEFLEQANIATAYNVKPSVLEAISRCSQTRIINSVDKLAIKPAQAGKCASFYLKTYVHDNRKKTYMYLSGCPKELGCTIVLRGGEPQVLKKIKRITEFMTFVVYNLKLETYLMRDEFALTPTYTGAGTVLPDKDIQKSIDDVEAKLSIAADVAQLGNRHEDGERKQVQASGHETLVDGRRSGSSAIVSALNPATTTNSDEFPLPEDVPMPTFWGDMLEQYKDKILSASPFVRFMQPYLLMRAREQERRLVYLKGLLEQDLHDAEKTEASKPEKFMLITPDMIHDSFEGTSTKVREVLRALQDAEYDKAVHNYRTQTKQWETYIAANINLYDPFTHQNIVVLYTVVCTTTSVPCSGPDLLALGFYNEHETNQDFEADCTVGQYVEDLCLGANSQCTSDACEKKMIEHHRQYVHGSAQLSVTVEIQPCKLRGYQDIILMWSVCRICGKETQVMPMSDNTWKYSFGKYLELSFWSQDLRPRAGVCPHDLHRDHLRFFGFKNIAICVRYDQINLLEIIVPRTRITWKVVNDLKFKNEVFRKAQERINRFMNSVKARIQSIRIDGVISEKIDTCQEEIDRLISKAEEQHRALISKLQDKYMGSKYFEVIPLNRIIRATQEIVAEWDTAFAEFDQNFFPSEKDIRRLATLQLKKIFLDRDDSMSSLNSTEEGGSNSISDIDFAEKASIEGTQAIPPQTRNMSAEKTQDMLNAVVEDNSSIVEMTESPEDTAPSIATTFDSSSNEASVSAAESQNVRHLDLAMPAFSDRDPDGQNADPGSQSITSTSGTTSGTSSGDAKDSSGNGSLESSATNMTDSIERLPSKQQMSNIPRPTEMKPRRMAATSSPSSNRTQSQPAHPRRTKAGSGSSQIGDYAKGHPSATRNMEEQESVSPELVVKPEKRLSERLGLNALKHGVNTHSMIPRSIASRRKESKVSNLAKHFEQLSREFEKERLRDRKQRASKSRQARAYPTAASKPIIEIYRNVHEAVAERGPSDEDLNDTDQARRRDSSFDENRAAQSETQGTPEDEFRTGDTTAEDTAAENTENDDNTVADSRAESEEGNKSDEEKLINDDSGTQGTSSILTPSEAQLELKLDLPKHEKNSLMKILTNFWAERSASGWQALDYPLRALDHVFADSNIIIREDEPSALIAFALDSEDYKAKLQSIQDRSKGVDMHHEKTYVDDLFLSTQDQMRIEKSLLQSTGTHLKYQFQEGSARMLCKIFYAEQFDAVRRKCGVADRIVESLSRCLKWDSKGGKTKSVFLKTLDDRLVLKSLSAVETQSFLRFAPAYFQLMGEALFHELPSVIAKLLGFYQIIIKNPVTGVEFNWFLLVMENLFYDRSPTRIFDLKGSMRNRRIQSTGEQNEVLLDENMVEFIYESPLFTREHSKKLLRASVWNDTLFLSRQNVMDYSLMVAIDEDRKELVVGIIDCIRTYTWDKKLESWMKDRGKNRPTVTSPREYKNRFREAMGRYVLQAPTCWHQFSAQQPDLYLSKNDSSMQRSKEEEREKKIDRDKEGEQEKEKSEENPGVKAEERAGSKSSQAAAQAAKT